MRPSERVGPGSHPAFLFLVEQAPGPWRNTVVVKLEKVIEGLAKTSFPTYVTAEPAKASKDAVVAQLVRAQDCGS